jgi:hypothetical protein
MGKDVTICFRTTEALRKALEKISNEDRRSVSSTIENVLYQFLEKGRELRSIQGEKRRFPRKKIAAPALIREVGSDQTPPLPGVVLDISLGGLQISVPDTYHIEIEEDKRNARISIVFTLPEVKKSLIMQCVPEHVVRSDGETTIGASFADTDFISYQTLQNYLIS